MGKMGKSGTSGVDEEGGVAGRSELGLEENDESGFGLCGSIFKCVGVKCVLVVVLSIALFLSALFWLPPFLRFADQADLDLDSRFKGHDIVASFNLNKSVSFLKDNIVQLEDDIFEEISISSIKLVILSIEASTGPNTTKVVFGVDPDTEYSDLSATIQSLVRAAFESFVVNETSLQLTKSLFGDSFSFEVLKFPGGITVIPPQSAFLLQKVQIFFNFTLNYSIYQLQVNFAELRSQLKEGLHLASYENVYIRLSNSKGSTVAPPTVVQSSVLLAIGYPTRLKQLAQTIAGHAKNLGLNHTVFGKVKQVRLSSILQHSLHGGEGGAPTPAPAPHPSHHHHLHHRHHHHHHHHHHHENAHLSPAVSPAPSAEKGAPATWKHKPLPSAGSPAPAPAPAPAQSSPASHNGNKAKPPGCRLGHKGRSTGNGKVHSHLSPTVSPIISPHISAPSPRPVVSQEPAKAPISHDVPMFSPLPSVVFAHVQPPSSGEQQKEHSDTIQSVIPSQPPSLSCAGTPTVQWAVLLLVAFALNI